MAVEVFLASPHHFCAGVPAFCSQLLQLFLAPPLTVPPRRGSRRQGAAPAGGLTPGSIRLKRHQPGAPAALPLPLWLGAAGLAPRRGGGSGQGGVLGPGWQELLSAFACRLGHQLSCGVWAPLWTQHLCILLRPALRRGAERAPQHPLDDIRAHTEALGQPGHGPLLGEGLPQGPDLLHRLPSQAAWGRARGLQLPPQPPQPHRRPLPLQRPAGRGVAWRLVRVAPAGAWRSSAL